ncbi:MAG: metal-sensing transcriptional repressor [Nitrospirae bacterium]|nr:metal-sensing transcriptional repressor [Nitrospirota bacterium]
MKEPFKQKSLGQFKKAVGMLNKVIKMVDEDLYCMDILQQSLAVNGIIKSANKTILEHHLNSCFKKGMQTNSLKVQQQLIDEVLRIVNKN